MTTDPARKPQLCVPVAITGGTLRLHFGDSTTKDVAVLTSGTLYNARSSDPALDALAYLAAEVEAGDAGGGKWEAGEDAGGYGLPTLTNTERTDEKVLAKIEFRDGLSRALFGFEDDTITVVGGVAAGALVRQGLWHMPPGSWPEPYVALAEPTPADDVSITQTPDGASTIDSDGLLEYWSIEFEDLPPWMVWPHYVKVGWLPVGAPVDKALALETWRQNFLKGGHKSFRFWPDADVDATFHDLRIGEEDTWIGDLREIVEKVSRQPYLLSFELTALEVPT